ncbi:MAG TPA: hypothetical protein VHJ20_10060 [Polyangia bacterium]|nr:hypothetical protein [Polyangia bacterium]
MPTNTTFKVVGESAGSGSRGDDETEGTAEPAAAESPSHERTPPPPRSNLQAAIDRLFLIMKKRER